MQTRLGVGRVAAELALANDDLPGAWHEVRPLLHEQYRRCAGYALPFLWVAARVVAAVRARPHAVSEAVVAEAEASVPEFRGAARAPGVLADACRVGGALRGRARRGGRGRRRRRCPAPTSAAWRAAVEAVAAPEAPGFLVPYALLRQAEAELAGADRAAARASLQAALDVADSGGVLAVRDRVLRVASAAGLTLEGVGGGAGLAAPELGVAGAPLRRRRTGRGRAHCTRTAGARAHRRGPQQPPDRRAPLHQRQDRERARLGDPAQARRGDPHRGGLPRRRAALTHCADAPAHSAAGESARRRMVTSPAGTPVPRR